MRIEIRPLPLGYEAIPISQRWQRRFVAHMRTMNQGSDCSVFFQDTNDLPEEVRNHRYSKDLENGWPFRMNIDPWIFGHWLGYDASTVTHTGAGRRKE